MVAFGDTALNVKSGLTVDVFPFRLTTWSMLGGPSEISSEALRSPDKLGRKLTVTVHCAPGASGAVHVFVWVKSA